ncbi:follicular epithelium yolk protein subunit [Fluviispira vulneris]|uniref:follicular epithelium yolk protein subunit n=1 Tax=Fluviispira vulneris TaxID=2763012 RepID=UPI001647454C|nr:follicular epithelium yolk protein subunit [Fluviispira vulneris]
MPLNLEIISGSDIYNTQVLPFGYEEHFITPEEREMFNIGKESQLKNAVEKHLGERPEDVHLLAEESPWGKIYNEYNWSPVKTSYYVADITIADVSQETVIISQKEFENKSSIVATYNASITESVANTIESTWNSSNKLSAGFNIKGKFSILAVETEATTSIGFEHTWGKGGTTRHMTTVGTSTGLSVTLKPKESVIAELIATRGRLKVKINYNVVLSGYILANYYPPYKDHHFWFMTIHKVLGKKHTRKVTENILINYYSNTKVVLKDKKSSKIIKSMNI